MFYDAADCQDVAMLSGFSSSLLEAFLRNNVEDFTPMRQMDLILQGHECYNRLKV